MNKSDREELQDLRVAVLNDEDIPPERLRKAIELQYGDRAAITAALAAKSKKVTLRKGRTESADSTTDP